MYTGFYETDLDKIALCAESVKTAKLALIEEDGIGSDLNINIFGWKNNELVTIVQLKNTFNIPKDERLQQIIEASVIMRQGWGIDEYTLAAEGYCSLSPSDTDGKDLAMLYAGNESSVEECISFTHLTADDHVFVTMPYKVKLGRKVEFGKTLWYNGGKIMRDIQFPAALKASLKIDSQPIDNSIERDVYFGTLASAIMHCGFEIFYRDDI
jgi:hypothetical protein